jgi:hypothetical protein
MFDDGPNQETAIMNNPHSEAYEYAPEMESFEGEHYGWGGEAEWSGEAEWGGEAEWSGEADVLSEAELMEFAQQLLGVSNEAELDNFLGDLLKGALNGLVGTVGKILPPQVANQVGGFLKGAAKAALPLAGQAVGTFFGGPLGGQIGRGAAAAAGNILGLEAELNAEDHEFEGAKKFVEMAADAVKTAATAPPGIDPSMVAGTAVTAAAEKHAPGLLESAARSPRQHGHHHHGHGDSGRWVRRGRNVVIVNCA